MNGAEDLEDGKYAEAVNENPALSSECRAQGGHSGLLRIFLVTPRLGGVYGRQTAEGGI